MGTFRFDYIGKGGDQFRSAEIPYKAKLEDSRSVWADKPYQTATQIGNEFNAHMDGYAQRNPWPPNRFVWDENRKEYLCIDCGNYCISLDLHYQDCVEYGKHCRQAVLKDDSIDEPYYMRVTSFGSTGRHHFGERIGNSFVPIRDLTKNKIVNWISI